MLAFASLSCTDGDAPPQLSTDLAVAEPSDLGGEGAPCATACDCSPGLACRNRTCHAGAVMVFCCGSTTCPASSLCEFSDGNVGQCDRVDGGGVPPVVDGGTTAAMCAMSPCTPGPAGNVFCKLACGRDGATCVAAGGNDHCAP